MLLSVINVGGLTDGEALIYWGGGVLFMGGGVLFMGRVLLMGGGLILGGEACSDAVCPSAVPGAAERGAAVEH